MALEVPPVTTKRQATAAGLHERANEAKLCRNSVPSIYESDMMVAVPFWAEQWRAWRCWGSDPRNDPDQRKTKAQVRKIVFDYVFRDGSGVSDRMRECFRAAPGEDASKCAALLDSKLTEFENDFILLQHYVQHAPFKYGHSMNGKASLEEWEATDWTLASNNSKGMVKSMSASLFSMAATLGLGAWQEYGVAGENNAVLENVDLDADVSKEAVRVHLQEMTAARTTANGNAQQHPSSGDPPIRSTTHQARRSAGALKPSTFSLAGHPLFPHFTQCAAAAQASPLRPLASQFAAGPETEPPRRHPQPAFNALSQYLHNDSENCPPAVIFPDGFDVAEDPKVARKLPEARDCKHLSPALDGFDATGEHAVRRPGAQELTRRGAPILSSHSPAAAHNLLAARRLPSTREAPEAVDAEATAEARYAVDTSRQSTAVNGEAQSRGGRPHAELAMVCCAAAMAAVCGKASIAAGEVFLGLPSTSDSNAALHVKEKFEQCRQSCDEVINKAFEFMGQVADRVDVVERCD